jgi:hypothetical protein
MIHSIILHTGAVRVKNLQTSSFIIQTGSIDRLAVHISRYHFCGVSALAYTLTHVSLRFFTFLVISKSQSISKLTTALGTLIDPLRLPDTCWISYPASGPRVQRNRNMQRHLHYPWHLRGSMYLILYKCTYNSREFNSIHIYSPKRSDFADRTGDRELVTGHVWFLNDSKTM